MRSGSSFLFLSGLTFLFSMVQDVCHALIAHQLHHPQPAHQQNPARRGQAVVGQDKQHQHHDGEEGAHHPEGEVAALADLLLLGLVTAPEPVLLKLGIKYIALLLRMDDLGGPSPSGPGGPPPRPAEPPDYRTARPPSGRRCAGYDLPATWPGY